MQFEFNHQALKETEWAVSGFFTALSDISSASKGEATLLFGARPMRV